MAARGVEFAKLAGAVATAAGVAYSTAHLAAPRPCCADSAHPDALSPTEWRPFRVVSNERVNHNVVRVRVGFPYSDQEAGLSVATCLLVRAKIGKIKEDGTQNYVVRPYTPISRNSTRGHLDLMVKVYPTGVMSKHIGALRPGSEIEMKGPISKLPYHANMKKHLDMIAGGTGITPMLQVLEEVLASTDDQTTVTLVYANRTPSDILMKSHLDSLAKKHERLKVHYVVEKTGVLEKLTWPLTGGSTGFITSNILQQHLRPPSDDSMVLVCGPPGLMAAVSGEKAPDYSQGEVSGLLADIGYGKHHVYKF